MALVMGINASKNLASAILISGLLAFGVISILGLIFHPGMEMKSNGEVTGCIFTDKTTLCKMNVIEHITLWQGMFTVTPQKASIFLVLFVMIALAFTTDRYLLFDIFHQEFARQNFYFNNHHSISIFDPLRQAFSQGILHPKIYEVAIR